MFDFSKLTIPQRRILDALLDKSRLNDPQLMAEVFLLLVKYALQNDPPGR